MPKSVRAKLNILAKARTIPTGSTTLTKLTTNNNCKSIIVYGGGALSFRAAVCKCKRATIFRNNSIITSNANSYNIYYKINLWDKKIN